MENIRSLFEVHEYAVTKGLNSTWDERQYSLYYNLYNHPYLSRVNDSGQNVVLFRQTGTGDYEDLENLELLRIEEDLYKFLVQGVVLTVVILFGIIGNLLNIVVLSEKKLKAKSVNRFLIGLAIVDLLLVVCSLYAYAIPNICAYFQIDFTKSQVMVPFAHGIGFTAHTASAYFTIAVTVERYLVVAYPLEARIRCTPTKAVLLSLLISACAFVYNIPRWWEYSYSIIVTDDGFVVTSMPLTTEFGRNATYKTYFGLSNFVLLYVIPMVALITLNALIYRQVKQAAIGRKQLTTAQKKENSLAIMLVVVVTVFLVCNGVVLASQLVKVATGQPNMYQLDSFRNLAVIFNSSINFLIYFAYGQKFRSHFLELASKWKSKCTFSSVAHGRSSTLRTVRSTVTTNYSANSRKSEPLC